MNNIKRTKSYFKIDTAASAPRYHWQGGLPCRGVLLLRAVCTDQFPWSIKYAPPAIPFDTPVTGMDEEAIQVWSAQAWSCLTQLYLWIVFVSAVSPQQVKMKCELCTWWRRACGGAWVGPPRGGSSSTRRECPAKLKYRISYKSNWPSGVFSRFFPWK